MVTKSVTLRMDAQQASMVQAWLESAKGVGHFENALGNVQQKNKQLGDTSKRTFGQMLMGMGQNILKLQAMGLALQAVRGGISMMTRDLERLRELGKESVGRQTTFGQELANIADILPSGANISITKIEDMIRNSKGGLNDAEEAKAVLEAISAGSGPDAAGRARTGLVVANLLAHKSAEERSAVAAEVVRAQEIFGGTAKQQAFIALAAQGASPSGGNFQQFSENTLAAASRLSGFGFKGLGGQEALLQLLIGFQNRSGDKEGASTATSINNMFRQLVVEANRISPDGRVFGAEDVPMLLSELQNNTRLGQQLRGNMIGALDAQRNAELQKAKELGKDPSTRDLAGAASVRAKSFVPLLEFLQVGPNLTKQKIADVAKDVNIRDAVKVGAEKRAELEKTQAFQVEKTRQTLNQLTVDFMGPAQATREMLIQSIDDMAKLNPQFGKSLFTKMKGFIAEVETFNEDDIATLRKKLAGVLIAEARAIGPQQDRPIQTTRGGVMASEPIPLAELREFIKKNNTLQAQQAESFLRAADAITRMTKVIENQQRQRTKEGQEAEGRRQR